MTISTFSVRNPVLVNILMVTLLILGFFSLKSLPREQFAEVPFFWVNITVPYPGTGSQDIEQLITIPIENEMNGLKNVDELQSTSSDGLSVVSVRFESNISKSKFDTLFQEVRTRFSRAELPDGVLKEQISAFSSNDFTPVIEIVLSGDVEYDSLVTTAEAMAKEIKRVKDVSGVDLVGVRDRQINVDINQNRLGNLGLSIDAVVQALRFKNLNVPAGNVKTNSMDYLVRTTGEVSDVRDFSNVILRRGTGTNGILYVRDVASVEETYKDDGSAVRYDGKPAVSMRVTKVPKGNSIAIVSDVWRITNNWRSRLSNEIRISALNDSTVQIRSSLNILLTNAVMGLILLVVILFFFIGLRNALMTALGIPLTFAMTFIALDIMGETFNSNTLFAMVLVLGLIVDHAIVIIENSYRLQQEGLSRHNAAIKGADQVVWPVIAATGTTVAAFLPLMILPGTIGRFLRVIPLTVSIALIASTFEALFFLPSHYADWPGKTHDEEKGRLFKRLKGFYGRVIRRLYTVKKRTVAISLGIMVLVLGLTGFLKQDLFSAEDFTLFYIDITMPVGTTFERTNRTVMDFEDRLLPLIGNGDVVAVSSSVGFLSSGAGNTSQGNVAQILVDLSEKSQGRTHSITNIMADVKNLTKDIPGPDKVFFRKAVNGPPQDPPVSYRLYGDNLEGLKNVSQAIRTRLSRYPQLLNIDDDFSGGKPELKIVVNEERASAYGLNVFSIGQYVRAAVSGVKATTFVKNNDSVDVVVRYQRSGRFSADEIIQLNIPAPGGRVIPFSAVADIVTGSSPTAIKRVDGRRVVTISADAYDNATVPAINADIESYVKETFSLRYPDQELVTGGEYAAFGTLLMQILQIFLIGVFLIYLILGMQFKSYSQPFLILVSVPMAFAGVVLYLFVSGTAFSTTVLYAGVALAGVAVNDAIVLISFINELRAQGLKTQEAVMTAAATRLRPIILTSLTTMAGLLPTALGLGGVSVVWQPMANTIIFGLLFSTLTALILVPMLYGVFYDRKPKTVNDES